MKIICKKEVYGLVLARKNSQRIKNKNIRLFKGRPLIEWTFQAAIKSRKIDKILCSTDDDKIIKNYKELNKIEFPYKRPSYLSTNQASSESAIIHLLKFYYKKNNFLPETFILLQPTSPLRKSTDIDKALSKYFKTGLKRLISITKDNGIYKLDKNKYLSKTNNDFFFNGAIYISDTKDFLKNKKIFLNNKTGFYLMSKSRSLDIDYEHQVI